MKTYLTFFILLFLSSCYKTEKIYFDNGELNAIGKLDKSGKWQGVYKEFDTLGTLTFIGTFKDGLRNGAFKWFYPNGNLKLSETYQSGIIKGIAQSYDSLGHLNYSSNYLNGKRVSWKKFDIAGNIIIEFQNIDSINLPDISKANINLDRDTAKLYEGDTILVDIKIQGISNYQIEPWFSNARSQIDFTSDSFNIWFNPKRPGYTVLSLFIKNTDTTRILIGEKRYKIKAK